MIRCLAAAILLAVLAACTTSSVAGLAGTYGDDQDGHMVPLLRVESTGASYTVSQYEPVSKSWVVDGTAYPLTYVQLQRLLAVKPDASMTGLQSTTTILVHVPKGWSQGRFVARTGYILRSARGAQELERMS